MTVVVVTDSTSCLPPQMAQAGGVEVIPLHVNVGRTSLVEGRDISSDEVAEMLRSGKESVSTSRAAPGDFVVAYREIAERTGATELVSVHLSSRISGTVDAAELAAAAVSSTVAVTVIDSRTLGMAMGYAALWGAEAARSGADAGHVSTVIRHGCLDSHAWFYVDSLEYLRRGGRIGAAAALLGGALSMKPLLQVADGVVAPWERVRTRGKALAKLHEQSVASALTRQTNGDQVFVAVHHFGFAKQAEQAAEQLRDALPGVTVDVVELGAVTAVHTGPGTLAVVVSGRRPSSTPLP